AGRRGQGRPYNQQSQQADGRPVGNREAGGLSRVVRFRVRRRSRLPDRRRGLSHFARGRLSFVAESRGRFRSGKGRLAPPSRATPITIGRDVSAVWGRGFELENRRFCARRNVNASQSTIVGLQPTTTC